MIALHHAPINYGINKGQPGLQIICKPGCPLFKTNPFVNQNAGSLTIPSKPKCNPAFQEKRRTGCEVYFRNRSRLVPEP